MRIPDIFWRYSIYLMFTVISPIDNQMSVNSEQNDVLYSYVRDTRRPQYQIEKLHFAMNNPVETRKTEIAF